MKTLVFILFFFLYFLANTNAQMRSFLCTEVHDGDTFTVNIGGVKLNCRIENIDCPELNQAYGKQSRDSLAKYILNKMVIVQFLKTDTYGRKVVNVWTATLPQRLDYLIAARGWGWYNYNYPPPLPVSLNLSVLQASAQNHLLGLWGCNNQFPPWEWRKMTAAQKRFVGLACHQ
jgi:micrococcal nuclease